MWGQLFLEASIQQNFNFGFSTHKSDILIHLSQWQYWWWFWFSLVWVVYYYVVVTDATKRSMTFNPVLNTSLRSHGKWGDFLVALIPLSWCGNILVNSNFILRIIEWQNESSLFTLRIQGKQWYWVYKYDGNAAVMIDSAPKNIGHDRWSVTTPSESYCADSYYQALHLAAQLEFQDLYKIELNKASTTKSLMENSTLYSNRVLFTNDANSDILEKSEESNYTSDNIYKDFYDFGDSEQEIQEETTTKIRNLPEAHEKLKYLSNLHPDIIPFLRKSKKIKVCPVLRDVLEKIQDEVSVFNWPLKDLYSDKLIAQHYDLLKVDDTQNTAGNIRVLLANAPLTFHAGILNDHVIDVLQSNIKLQNPLLFTATFNNIHLETKVYPTEDLWGFRQKRYKRLKEFKFTPKVTYDPNTFESSIPEKESIVKVHSFILNKQLNLHTETKETSDSYVGKLSYRATANEPYSPTTLNIQKSQTVNTNNAYYFYSSLRLNKKRSEVLSVNLARRLLRTKRTLVLPSHVNITVITNSYDVVHSWFIPGLGLKFDCVPGRSTHHTLYIDNVGFYYGQCAEICGRYHHHMPIRVCAIPFEQFLVWWRTKGLPRTLRLHHNKNFMTKGETKDVIHKAFIQYRYNF